MTATDLDTIARAIHARLTGDPRLWAVVDEVERMLYRLAAFDAREVMETLYLLRNPANAARLLRSIEEANAGRLAEHEVSQQLREPAKPRRARGHSKSTAPTGPIDSPS